MSLWLLVYVVMYNGLFRITRIRRETHTIKLEGFTTYESHVVLTMVTLSVLNTGMGLLVLLGLRECG